MEFVVHDDGSKTQIPDAVIAASVGRELVEDYVKASPTDRDHIHQLAIEQLGLAETVALTATVPALVPTLVPASDPTPAAAPSVSSPPVEE